MAVIRYTSPNPGEGVNAIGFISSMFGGLQSLHLSPTELKIIGAEVRTSWIGTDLTYFYGPGVELPLPVPDSGQLDRLVMKYEGKTIWTIDGWNMTGQKMLAAFKTGDEVSAFNVFFGANDKIFGTGAVDFLWGGGGKDVIRAAGGGDSISGFTGNDTIFGDAGSDSMSGDSGNDRLFGGSGNDALGASVGADSLYGGEATDTLDGGAGHDLVSGGLGADLLIGGGGDDRFLFNSKIGAGQIDNVGDFSVADDLILLDNDIFQNAGALGILKGAAFRLGADATTAAHRIMYDSTTGNLWYDRDGAGGAAKVQIATLDDGLAITRNHFQIVE
jgi:Ca2+-binding RTX toxin-like protein